MAEFGKQFAENRSFVRCGCRPGEAVFHSSGRKRMNADSPVLTAQTWQKKVLHSTCSTSQKKRYATRRFTWTPVCARCAQDV